MPMRIRNIGIPVDIRVAGNKKPAVRRVFRSGSPGWIRTTECLSQSQVPYRLATGL